MHLKSPYPPVPAVPDSNIHHCLFNPLPGQPTAPDYTLHVDATSGYKRSWFEFRELVLDGATALASSVSIGGLGLSSEAGDMVGIFSHNCLDYIALVNSLLAITVPIALLSAYSTSYELAHALRTSKANRLFVQPSLLPKVLAAAKEVGLPSDHIYVLEGRVDGRKSFQNLVDNVRSRGITRVPPKPATKTTLAYLVFSSGTSGLPKAVMISHGNLWAVIIASAMAKAVDDKMTQEEPPKAIPISLLFLPFYHSYGLFMGCLRVFNAPATNVIVPKWDTGVVLKAIPRFRISALPLFPSAMHQLVNHKDIERTDLSSLVHIFTGAAYMPPALEAKFKKLIKTKYPMFEGYGMSEMTLSVARKSWPEYFGKPKPGCAGVLAPGVEARIVRADGSEADVDEPGEIWVRGPNMALGYYNNEKATKEAFVDGWLRTGDHLKADKDGLLYFVDRVKDTLKVSGVQVSPTEIEDALMAHPNKLVEDVCVAGVSGGRTSDEKNPRAWVVLTEEGKRRGPETTLKMLDEWTKKTLSQYKWLRGGYEVVDAIPKNPTGKVLRRVLQDRYEQAKASKAKL